MRPFVPPVDFGGSNQVIKKSTNGAAGMRPVALMPSAKGCPLRTVRTYIAGSCGPAQDVYAERHRLPQVRGRKGAQFSLLFGSQIAKLHQNVLVIDALQVEVALADAPEVETLPDILAATHIRENRDPVFIEGVFAGCSISRADRAIPLLMRDHSEVSRADPIHRQVRQNYSMMAPSRNSAGERRPQRTAP